VAAPATATRDSVAADSAAGRSAAGSALLLVAILVLAVAAVALGQVRITLAGTLQGLFDPGADPVIAQIVREIRLPRILTALVAGGALGAAGVLMQSLFRNPMADAWSLGLTAGGQLGVALAVTAAAFAGPSALAGLTALRGVGLTVAAALGVAVAAVLVMGLGRRLGAITLLVVGLMIWFTAQGLVSVVIHFANRAGGRVFSGWNDGTFTSVTPEYLPMLAVPVLAGLSLAVASAKPLTTLLIGEAYARSLGTDIGRLRLQVLVATVFLVAPVTAFCGPVIFVGLIVPHFARAIAGTARVAPLLAPAALSGAFLALAADFVVHLPWDQHFLHLNAVLALVGAPVVVALVAASPGMRAGR
jgi:iron complex transport system permease protein